MKENELPGDVFGGCCLPDLLWFGVIVVRG